MAKIKLSRNKQRHAKKSPASGGGRSAELAQQGLLLEQQGHQFEALLCYRQALLVEPTNSQLYLKIAEILLRTGRDQELCELVRNMVDVNGCGPADINFLARNLYARGREKGLLSLLQFAVERWPEDSPSWCYLGWIRRLAGDFAGAEQAFSQAIALKPDYTDAIFRLGQVLYLLGRPAEEWQSCLKKVLELDPRHTRALMLLVAEEKHGRESPLPAVIATMLEESSLSVEEREDLLFAQGKIFEDQQDYDRAFASFVEANRLHRQTHPYDQEATIGRINALTSCFTANFFAGREVCRTTTAIRPIFVLGMPRSGTSLVEQILASHPLVFGAGELTDLGEIIHSSVGLPTDEGFCRRVGSLDLDDWSKLGEEYLQRLERCPGRQGQQYVTDKMPFNFFHIGFIKLIFPSAAVVHCLRDPLSNCWSIFKNSFEGGNDYAYDLDELGKYYRMYQALAAHWRSVLPEFIYDLPYENLVTNTEMEVRDLLNFCNLPWSDACLEFYRTERVVATLSTGQVRRPIYTDSLRLSQRYGDNLAPLAAVLNS